jgi:hypothetical protein
VDLVAIVEWMKKYLSWRPLMTADDFWVGLLKSVPYEVVTAYCIIRGAYPHTYSMSTTGFLLAVLVVLSVAVFFLHRTATGSTVSTALALAICFLLFALSVDARNFRNLSEDEIGIPFGVVVVIKQILQPYYLLSTAVLIVLFNAGLRPILGRTSK